MSAVLPDEIQRLVDTTLSTARLPGAEHERVRRELECHFADGLGAGHSASAIAEAFGDPALAGMLIRRARRTSRRWQQSLRVGLAAAAACYIAAVISVQSAPDAPATLPLARDAEQVFVTLARAEAALADASGLAESYRLAAGLRRRRDYWSETAGLILLDRVTTAADSLLDEPNRTWLRDSVRALAASEGLAPRRDLVDAMRPAFVGIVGGAEGRVGREGRLLLVRAKGTRTPSRRALLVEPFYFALPVSRARLDAFIREVSERQLDQAGRAARRIAARVS
jgi:hypothetical protein